MKRLFICIIPLLLLIAIGVYNPAPSGDSIRIYATGGDVGPLVERINERLARHDITVLIVHALAESDVTVNVVNVAGSDPHCSGFARPIFGSIEIVPSKGVDGDFDSDILLHEILHCAGRGHENDRTSIMYPRATWPRRLKPEHVEALRSLAGITLIGRIRAHIRFLF